jgi:uncharacterized protein (TIGR00725 family)
MQGDRYIISVFGSSSVEAGSLEERIAYETGKTLAEAGFVVCNGGYGGTMEASARGAKEAGGNTIGIITKYYPTMLANRWIDQVITVDTMVDRLLRLINTGDGYVVLRGGTGTLLELAASWEMMNKRVLMKKPVVAMAPFWDPVVRFLKEELLQEGRTESSELVTVARTPEECVGLLIHNLGIKHET